jgi:hypothetical protein
LSDIDKRRQYDQLIFGSLDNKKFTNQEAYEYFRKMKKKSQESEINIKEDLNSDNETNSYRSKMYKFIILVFRKQSSIMKIINRECLLMKCL